MPRYRSTAGFTLIETVVALVIFVACYLLLYQGTSLGWRSIQVVHMEAAALQVAQNRLALAGIDPPLQEGRQTGRTDDGFDWSVDVRRSPQAQSGDASPARLGGYWVTVQVDWREGPLRAARSLRLTTLKLAAAR
jgi:prepilin-type N-terminal cleavage/methylation domain-containing protein